jgi:carbamoyltransferase
VKVLGVSYGYHDASASMVVDGKVVASSAEERFTRQKHDANFPTYAVEFCLREAGLTPQDLDQAVFHEDPHAKFSRVLTSAMAAYPDTRREFVESMKSWLGRKLWAINAISSRLDLPPEKITYLGHHFSHAVQAFMGSGFEESAILVVDAVGDWACSALYKGAWKDGRPQVERLLEVAFPNSLGLVYSAITAYLGFSPNDSEASTMALAAFGEPRFAEEMRRIIAPAEDGLYVVDQRYFNFSRFFRGPVTDLFLEAFGPPRDVGEPYPWNSFQKVEGASPDARRLADVAASIQLVLEERVLGLAQKLHALSPSQNLCFAGGVSLNCVLNYRLLKEGPFAQLFVPPDPGDGGTSVGTALYYDAHQGGGAPGSGRYTPYQGAQFDESDDVKIVDFIKPEKFLPYLKPGVTLPAGQRGRYRTFKDRGELLAEVAGRLLDGQMVGWVQGRSEIGPRALGNRSILIRPDDTELAMRLSKKVKERAPMRPYAFSVAERDAARTLDIDPAHLRAQRWMQYAVPVKEEAREKLGAAVHIDGTTRPQVCAPEDNPLFHDLLVAFGERFGVAALLNTSFNPSGYPMVTSPPEAMAMFARTEMDALVLNNTVVWKHVNQG